MTDKMQSLALAPVGNLDSYIRAANAWPMLSADEERALAEKLHYHGDLEAAKTLILSHLRFVVHIARNYAGYGLPQADLIQEGNIGLMKAVRRFNPEVGVRLVSFAVHWIKAEIHEYVLRNWRIVKVATTKAQRKLFFNLRKTKQRLGWFNQDEVEMVARELGVTSKDVREMESRMAAQDMTFDLSSDDDSDSQPMAPVLYLQDKSSNFADGIEDDNWEEQAANRLTDAMQGLDERSQDIIRARWLDEDNKSTLQELAVRTLLESTVWVPGTAAQGEAVVEDSALDLQHWEKEDGTSVIPFFTSLEALQQAVEDEQAFVVMPVRTLFEMTLGETLFLNAKLPTGKEFMPREISLLIGEEGNPLSSQEILEGGESLILSEVAEPPAQMIDSLTTLFKTIKPVKRAFICSIKENEEAQPNLLIGIEADGDIEEIIQATGSVATDTLPGDEPIDICQVKKGEKGISHFITEHIAPFYERRWGGFLRDFKQNRII